MGLVKAGARRMRQDQGLRYEKTCRQGLVPMLTSLFLLASGISVFAQSEPGRWVGDLYLTTHYITNQSNFWSDLEEDEISEAALVEYEEKLVFIDENNVVREIIPSILISRNLPVPNRYFASLFSGDAWSCGALYKWGSSDAQQRDDGTRLTRWSLAKWFAPEEEGEREWHYLGEYITDNRELLRFIPCENDRFIVVSLRGDLTGNNNSDRTPFARMSLDRNKKEFRLDFPIAHRQDELQKYILDQDIFGLAWVSNVVLTDKHATLLNSSTGLYWIFSLENASLVKAGNIFNRVTPEMIAKGGFLRAVLCVNPEKEGTILVAAQDEAFLVSETLPDPFKEHNELLRQLYNQVPKLSVEEYNAKVVELRSILDERLEELKERNPYIVWYRLDPETGRVEKLPAPPEGGTNLRDGGKNDVWRPMPDGSVRMGHFELNLVEKPEHNPIIEDASKDSSKEMKISQ